MKLIRRLFLFFSAVLFAMSLGDWMDARQSSSREIPGSSSVQPADSGYLVRSDGDRVCVTSLSGGRSLYLEGIKVSDLPEADRLQLAAGFSLPDDDALLALFEDYTG